MNDDPIKLTPLSHQPSEAVVLMLENLLVEARAGRVNGLVAITFEPGGNARQWRSGRYILKEVLWVIEHLKHAILTGDTG